MPDLGIACVVVFSVFAPASPLALWRGRAMLSDNAMRPPEYELSTALLRPPFLQPSRSPAPIAVLPSDAFESSDRLQDSWQQKIKVIIVYPLSRKL